ncbi:MAG: hypothetical protein LBH96_04815, partial [Candidatus Peribacteria bacterium]|nr:hypothetical protein [Candidatus Peribacteria bacterium]
MNSTSTKDSLYQSIIKACEKLTIARYLKNEVKNSLQYFHSYKLQNIKKNLKAFTNYLLFLNEENSNKIQELEMNTNNNRILNNNLSYFYDNEHITSKEKKEITQKIESNSYQVITLMQGIKGLLLLTIDEFCNASPTRMEINTFLWKKE